ncbi:putative membrane protein [Entomortierella parvispora]|uniref:Membrane protein n=1 Tax=Entomortierella parvispora TaxID=205924 RepID=A0A9P3HBK8_9FUNG|nr:putative membrane protein [Entomortierella parvispora]
MDKLGEPLPPTQPEDELVNQAAPSSSLQPALLTDDSRSRFSLGALSKYENSAPADGSNQSDDAITRHCSPPLSQNRATHTHQDNCEHYEQDCDGHNGNQNVPEPCLDHSPERPALAVIQSPRDRRRTLSLQSRAHSERSFRIPDGDLAKDQTTPCDLHGDHGTSAMEEEEAALQCAAELRAAKRASLITSNNSKISKLASKTLNSLGLSSELPLSATLTPPECIEDEEEHDNFLSGLCIPESKFFMTSVICSNTMTRDGLANERTFLAWSNVCVALCLVSFTFISKSFSLDSLDFITRPGQPAPHKDKLSMGVGYTCFITAFLASIYNVLRYLRNIRRISTRYPFAQEGKWTFTVGMFLGILIMVILVLAYTTHI